MKVLLINPPRFNGIPVIREERCEITERYSVLPPYSLLQVGSLLRADGHEVALIDANGFNLSWEETTEKIQNTDYDALVFRFTPTTFDDDTKVAVISKSIHPQAWTIGICWTLHTVPKDVLESCKALDIYIRHEYEAVTPLLISALSKGTDLSLVGGIAFRSNEKIEITPNAQSLKDWDSLPLPAYDLLPSLKNYFINTQHGSPFTTLYTSKGCPYSCIFCTVRNTPVKKRSAESILNEMRYLKKNFNIKMVSFFDESFTLDRDRVMAICAALMNEKLKITWYCNTRVNLVDQELLKAMYDAGCRGLSYGIESGSQKIIDLAKKGTTIEQAEKAIKWAKKVGIKVYCSFIFGLPGENNETVKDTISFVRRTLPNGAQFNVAVPYPGSELYRIATEKQWIKPGVGWREMYQHNAIMHTDTLSYEELEKARKEAYHTLYFNLKWWSQNIWYTAKHPQDFPLAFRYVLKIVKNYSFNKMSHSH